MHLIAKASTIEVGAGKPFTTITSALSAAKDGDLILINKGVYAEGEILITKKVTLKGINRPVIDGKKIANYKDRSRWRFD